MGFGNRLLPWARCRIFAHLHAAKMVSPVWIRPALGQLRRGGVDYRAYLRQLVLWGLFHRREGDLGPLQGLVKTRSLPVLPEPEDLRHFAQPQGDGLIIFRGLGRYFEPLQGWSGFLRDELAAITQPRFLAVADQYPWVPIGMCIRLGNDYKPCPTDRDILKPGEKTPIEWFVNCLQVIRQAVEYPAAAYIVSDGTPEQLKHLLNMEKVYLVRPGSAISDLLVMSKSQVLLSSGSSSFAAWGAFFGQMPTVSHLGQSIPKEFLLRPEMGQYLGEFNPKVPDEEFLWQCRLRLATC